MSMILFSRLMVVALLSIGWLAAQDVSDIRLNKFKERMNYHATNYQDASIYSQTQVISGIPDTSACPILSGNFRVVDEGIYLIEHGEGISKRIRYSSNQETVDITFNYVPNNHQQIERLFFKVLSSANSGEIPGKRGPLDLGDISVELPDPSGTDIHFLYDNIYTRIQAYDKTLDVIGIARWMQSQFQMHPWSEVQNKMPRPARESIGKRNVRVGQALLNTKTSTLQGKVGEPFEVNVELPSGTDKSHYLIRGDYDHQRFRSTLINNILTITPTKPGQWSFRYVLIDKKTLLFSTYEVPVDVQP